MPPSCTTASRSRRSAAPHASGFFSLPASETCTRCADVFFTVNTAWKPGVPLVLASCGTMGENITAVTATGRV